MRPCSGTGGRCRDGETRREKRKGELGLPPGSRLNKTICVRVCCPCSPSLPSHLLLSYSRPIPMSAPASAPAAAPAAAPAPVGPLPAAPGPLASLGQIAEFTSTLKSLSAFVHKAAPTAELRAYSMSAAEAQSITQRHADLQAQLRSVHQSMESLHAEAVALHHRASGFQLSSFAPGSFVVQTATAGLGLVPLPHLYGRVVRCDPQDGQVKVEWIKFHDGDQAPRNALGEPGVWVQPYQIKAVAADDQAMQAEVAAAQAEVAAKRAAFAVYAAAPCPVAAVSGCVKCGHRLCGSYHYVDLSSLSGWQLACASPLCRCFQCTQAKRRGRALEDREMGCCKCIRERCDCCH